MLVSVVSVVVVVIVVEIVFAVAVVWCTPLDGVLVFDLVRRVRAVKVIVYGIGVDRCYLGWGYVDVNGTGANNSSGVVAV